MLKKALIDPSYEFKIGNFSQHQQSENIPQWHRLSVKKSVLGSYEHQHV